MAGLVIRGMIDADLSGGRSSAVLLDVTADVADLSRYGFGSANNGGGTYGEELEFSGTTSLGYQILVAGDSGSSDFFSNNFTDTLLFFQSNSAQTNGNDAVEIFFDDAVSDTLGVVDTHGDGEPWELHRRPRSPHSWRCRCICSSQLYVSISRFGRAR